MRRILVVDDEEKIRAIIRKYGEFEGYDITEAKDGMEAVKLCREQDFDVIILDIMMPELDGFSTCREIRKTKNIPVIMLSARGEEYDKIHGFELGIDDYVVKPFELEVLYSRIRALLRRAGNVPEQYLSCDSVRLDQNRMMVFCGEEEITLSQSEYQLLLLLIRNKGKTVTRERILQQLWDSNGSYVNDNTLTVYIKRLREKIEKEPAKPEIIKTIRGMGYGVF